ncbi:MAG: hypothetical protein Fur0043_18780 [Anaerolineales bacterium]
MILNLPFILETRRNHALEHATIHILAARYPDRHFAGHSNPTGFFLLGNVATDDVETAVTQALTRLRAGERELAIHAGCGTNFASTALLAGTLAWLPLNGARSWRKRFWLLPFAFAFGLLGYAISQPLGPWLQAHITTDAEMGDLRIASVVPVGHKGVTVHRVITMSPPARCLAVQSLRQPKEAQLSELSTEFLRS